MARFGNGPDFTFCDDFLLAATVMDVDGVDGFDVDFDVGKLLCFGGCIEEVLCFLALVEGSVCDFFPTGLVVDDDNVVFTGLVAADVFFWRRFGCRRC